MLRGNTGVGKQGAIGESSLASDSIWVKLVCLVLTSPLTSTLGCTKSSGSVLQSRCPPSLPPELTSSHPFQLEGADLASLRVVRGKQLFWILFPRNFSQTAVEGLISVCRSMRLLACNYPHEKLLVRNLSLKTGGARHGSLHLQSL